MKLKQSLKDSEASVKIKKLWDFKCKENFSVLCVGSLFRQHGITMVTGGEDAILRCYSLTDSGSPSYDEPQVTLETKSGPIQTMAIHDVTKFYHNDLLVGDSLGSLTIICNQQILSRQSVSPSSLSGLQVHQDAVGISTVIVSNDTGVVFAVLPEGEQWIIDLNNCASIPVSPSASLKVSCMTTADLVEDTGRCGRYLLVADNMHNVYFLSLGMVVLILTAPATVTAMCKGRFVGTQKLDLTPGKDTTPVTACGPTGHHHQVALGTDTGAIYLLHNFAITLDEFANAQSPITHLCTLPGPDCDKDLLLCGGQFNKLHVYQEGQSVCELPTPDWVNTIAVADINGDGTSEAVFGCLDKSVHAIKVTS